MTSTIQNTLRPFSALDATGSPLNIFYKTQEIAFDDPRSQWMFQPSSAKPFLITRAVDEQFGGSLPLQCLLRLQMLAKLHHGLDYLQVFQIEGFGEDLWFIEDGDGGAITALLPSDY